MALSPKEREKIVEEERLRYETRQALHAEACAKHPRRGRWLWWLAAAFLAYAAYSYIACGRGWCSSWAKGCKAGYHGQACKPGCEKPCCKGKKFGAHCRHGMAEMDEDPGVEPGQPIPKKP
jgi:hypothetical protein